MFVELKLLCVIAKRMSAFWIMSRSDNGIVIIAVL
jgi:hypothetical protein